MKKWILAVVAVMGIMGFAFAENIWPWGADCGVLWSDVEGEWRSDSRSTPEYFEVKMTRGFRLGERLFEIRHYNSSYQRVGKGVGFWKPGDTELEALIEPNTNLVQDESPYYIRIKHALQSNRLCPTVTGDVTVSVQPWMGRRVRDYSVERTRRPARHR